MLQASDGWEPVPHAPAWKDRHMHPNSGGEMTEYQLGTQGPDRFSATIMVETRTQFQALMQKQQGTHAFSNHNETDLDGEWSMDVAEGSVVKKTMSGPYKLEATFWRV